MPKPLTVWIATNCGKFLETGIPNQLTCLLRNLYACQEATLRTSLLFSFQIRKGVCQGCILSPCLFKLYAEYIMWNARLDEAQAGIKIARKNINNLRHAGHTTLIAEPQHTRPPCPSPTPGVYLNPCPSSQWCHPAISSSGIRFSTCPQSFPASGSFPVSQLFTSGGQSIGVSASTPVLPMNTKDWSPLGWTGWVSLKSKGLSRVFSNTPAQKHQLFCAQLSL